MTSVTLWHFDRPLTLHTLAMNIQPFKHLSAFLIELNALTFPIPFPGVTSDLYSILYSVLGIWQMWDNNLRSDS